MGKSKCVQPCTHNLVNGYPHVVATKKTPAQDPERHVDSAPAAPVVGIRDLRADVAALVRRAGAGEHVVISVGGRPLAHLGPLQTLGGATRIEDLIASGQVIAPRRTGSYRAPAPVPVWHGSRIDRLLHDIR